MTIKEIVKCAFKLLGREDIISQIDEGVISAEEADNVQTMLYCVNAVENELARYYFHKTYTQSFSSKKGEYYFSAFEHRPLKILSVKAHGKSVDFSRTPYLIKCEYNEIEVEYEYLPEKKELENGSFYEENELSKELIAYGAAAEYCLISGAVQLSKLWESRYREAIDETRAHSRLAVNIPPRRWV